MESSPPKGKTTGNGDCTVSRSEQFPVVEDASVTMAIPDSAPNSATYTPPPVPFWLIKPTPPRYDHLEDCPLIGSEVHPHVSRPVVLLNRKALTLAPCVLTT